MHRTQAVERGVLRAGEAYRVDILGHADHGGRHAVGCQGFAERIFPGPEGARQAVRDHD